MPERVDLPLARALPTVLFLTAVFFANFLSRIFLAPFLPVVQADLGLNHGQSGELFLLLAAGNGLGLLSSGFVAARLGHKRTIAASALVLGAALISAAACRDALLFRLSLGVVGLGAGLYLPSGIASLMAVVRAADWGKAVALHEVAPNGSQFLAPLLAEAAMLCLGWRQALAVLGVVQLGLCLAFLRYGRAAQTPARPPVPSVVGRIVRRPQFWLLALFFGLGAGGSFGPYTMLPLYLTDLGWTRPEANELLALSRLGAVAMPFLSGWLVDRFGARPLMAATFFLSGLGLMGVGLASGWSLAAVAVVQPLFAVTYFPAGFTALSLVFGAEERSTAVSLIIPLSIVLGIGLIPTLLGHLGDAGLFRHGFLLLAGCELCGVLLTRLLRLPAGS